MKVCFIGSGSIGCRHIRNFNELMKEEECQIDILKMTDRKLPEDIEAIVSRRFKDVSEMDGLYDAIFITNPTNMHAKTILEMKEKSKYFFVEKPVVDDVDLYEQMLTDLPQDNKYYVACPLRYTKVLMSAGEFVKDHLPYSVRAISSSYLPKWRNHIDYRTTYSAHKNQGGGVQIDLIHEWDYLYGLFGSPKEVKCLYGTYSDLEIDSEDLAVYIASYKDFLIELHLDYFGVETQRYLEIMCKEGTYKFDIAHAAIYLNGKLETQFKELPNDKYMQEMKFFIEMCRGEQNSVNTIEHAIDVLKIASGK